MDLDAYLTRLGGLRPADRSLATLCELHVAHLAHIPFENVDVRLGRPIRLDLDALQAKLVAGRRGGYCFEHNALLAAALRALGYPVTTLEARVRPPGASAPLPRTHMVLAVAIDGASPVRAGHPGATHLADVGFGGDGPLWPVPLDGSVAEQPDGQLRVSSDEPGLHVLQRLREGTWRDLYSFTLAPALPVDYEVANYYTSTHPSSRFVLTLTAQLSTVTERHILRDHTYTRRRADVETTRQVEPGELAPLLRDTFGLALTDAEIAAAVRGPTVP